MLSIIELIETMNASTWWAVGISFFVAVFWTAVAAALPLDAWVVAAVFVAAFLFTMILCAMMQVIPDEEER